MAAMVQGAWSEDPAAQLEATTQFRKLLSIGAFFGFVFLSPALFPRRPLAMGCLGDAAGTSRCV
jgi:hypothetical protein